MVVSESYKHVLWVSWPASTLNGSTSSLCVKHRGAAYSLSVQDQDGLAAIVSQIANLFIVPLVVYFEGIACFECHPGDVLLDVLVVLLEALDLPWMPVEH